MRLTLASPILRMITVLSILGVVEAFAVGSLHSQTKTAAPQRFEVASVKACSGVAPPAGARSGGGTGHVNVSPGRVDMQCWSLFQLINFAYVVNGDSLLNDAPRPGDLRKVRGGPAWVYSSLYHIEAKADGEPARRVMIGSMLQALLEDRFQLKVHRETEEAPIYALTVAKGGLKLKPMADGGCLASFDPKTHPSFFRPGEKMPCGLIQDDVGPQGTVIVEGAGIGLDRIARTLSDSLDRYVVDRTGVTEVFNVRLEFARDENMRPLPGGGPPVPPSDVAAGPSVFAALEQLGLKLAPDKGPRGFIVIDRVAKPSGN
jgi:uncharacterized protein (TIGR03435 family)